MKRKCIKGLLLLIVVMSLVFSLPFGYADSYAIEANYNNLVDTSNNLKVGCENIVEEYSKFINDNYNVLFSKEVTKKEFTNAFSKVLNYVEEEQKNNNFTSIEALSIAVRAAGLKELAYTYPDEKIINTLEEARIVYNLSEQNKKAAQEIAVAIDTGLIPQEFYYYIIDDKPVDSRLDMPGISVASSLLSAVPSEFCASANIEPIPPIA